MPANIHIAEVEAGGGEMFATIEHAKLHQSERPWASWSWLGNVAPDKIEHFKEAIGKFGEEFLETYETEAFVAERTTLIENISTEYQ